MKLKSMLKSMLITNQEKQGLRATLAPVGVEDPPRYPYGLEIHLTTESIKKLGINTADHSPGDVVHIKARAEVTTVSSTRSAQDIEGPANESLYLQITDLGIGFDDDDVEE